MSLESILTYQTVHQTIFPVEFVVSWTFSFLKAVAQNALLPSHKAAHSHINTCTALIATSDGEWYTNYNPLLTSFSYSVHLKLSNIHLKNLCGKMPNQPMADEADPEYKTIQFVFSGVIVLTVGVFGFVGNIFTCVFLKMMSKGMTPFNKLLVTLAIFDMMFICLGGSFITKEALR